MRSWKKLLLLLLIVGTPALSGCGLLPGSIQELEQLRVLQAMGLDRDPAGVLLSLAPAEEAAEPYSAPGPGITAAMERIRSKASEEELFLGHMKELVVGEEAAKQGLEELLSLVCRSSELRLDMPLYILQGDQAQALLTQPGSGALLQALDHKQQLRYGEQRFTAGRLQRDLDRSGSGLACLLTLEDGGEDEKRPVIAGLGIIRDDRLLATLDQDEALGAAFLLNSLGSWELTLRDGLSLLLRDGGSELEPIWDEDGVLIGLAISARVTASVLEAPAENDIADERFADRLTGQLEAAVSERIGAALEQSRRLGADFLGLGDKVAQAAPSKAQALPDAITALLPDLELRISVRGTLVQTLDME